MNKKEIDVLKVLWKSQKPMSLADIVNNCEGLSKSSVNTILARLLKEKQIEVAGITYSGKVLSRTYRPTEASKNKVLQEISGDMEYLSDIIPETAFFASFLGMFGKKASAEEIKKLESILEEYKRENQIE